MILYIKTWIQHEWWYNNNKANWDHVRILWWSPVVKEGRGLQVCFQWKYANLSESISQNVITNLLISITLFVPFRHAVWIGILIVQIVDRISSQWGHDGPTRESPSIRFQNYGIDLVIRTILSPSLTNSWDHCVMYNVHNDLDVDRDCVKAHDISVI